MGRLSIGELPSQPSDESPRLGAEHLPERIRGTSGGFGTLGLFALRFDFRFWEEGKGGKKGGQLVCFNG